ncbi:MAG: polysaccharide deacetylase family protein, partial [Chitinispirillaceae bacterium]|nr:polysaccharide deacetylase family protein [Chitinispirillaceae bacterium]
AFWKTVVMYYVNDFCLLLLNRPLFRSFPDFRSLRPAGFPGGWMVPFAMTLFFIFFAGWLVELPLNQMMGTVLAKGPNVKAVALTFDDGPGASTAPVLDILRKHNVKATFFVIGKNAQERPELIKRIVQEGHEIGNHSYSHALKLAIESSRALKKEIDATETIIRNLTGVTSIGFRPPRGWRTPWMIRECRANGYEVVLWTIDSQDWLHVPRDRIVENVLRKIRPGSIILLHDRLNTGRDKGMANTIEALPAIIEALSREGFIFVTISELRAMDTSREKWLSPVSDSTAAAQY